MATTPNSTSSENRQTTANVRQDADTRSTSFCPNVSCGISHKYFNSLSAWHKVQGDHREPDVFGIASTRSAKMGEGGECGE
ncbi:hypothetical protein J6590_079846 [Homalodisca vitripennis]|nr:hypothetical protein J6590_079846 [Homalodisca vitripennis]